MKRFGTHFLIVAGLLTAMPIVASVIALDENGDIRAYGVYSTGYLGPDPGPGGLSSVLIYTLPFTGAQGDVLSFANDIGDVIRFNGDGTVIFYSDNLDGFDSLADTSAPPGEYYTNQVLGTEVGNETYSSITYNPTQGQPGYDPSNPTYVFVSDGTLVPEPNSFALIAAGLGALGYWRLRRKLFKA